MRYLIQYLTKLTLQPSQHRLYSQEVPKALRSVKSRSTRATVQYYVDSQRVKAVGGNGGDGCVSFMHAWCKDRAGPDGGDGGNGGHVIFKASTSVRSLNHISRVIKADDGEKGYNKECHGKSSPHITVLVPIGTVVKDECGGVVCDLSSAGGMWVAARGGAGGRGNQFFLSAVQQAPDIAEYGAEGESQTYTLELRSMAHIGLIGFPNAGKSTLLRAISRARPTVAPYPFTTRRPHVGMVPYSDYEQVAVADLPGLIPGSHKNYGLGIQFLKHVERCCGLLYILDGTTNNPFDQYRILQRELTSYSVGLTNRPSQIVVNKIDVPEARRFFEKLSGFLSNGGRLAEFGMVPYSDYEQVAVADLPGLIPGSHKNYGLGIQFLKHVERCCGLLYILDGTTNNPFDQYRILQRELTSYSVGLTNRPSQIVVNKIDVPEARRFFEKLSGFLSNGGRLAEFGEKSESRKKLTEFDEKLSDSCEYSTSFTNNISESNVSLSNDNGERLPENKDISKTSSHLSKTFDNKSSNPDLNVKANVFYHENTDKTSGANNLIINSNNNVETVIGISAKTGEGVPRLLAVVRKMYDLTNLS